MYICTCTYVHMYMDMHYNILWGGKPKRESDMDGFVEREQNARFYENCCHHPLERWQYIERSKVFILLRIHVCMHMKSLSPHTCLKGWAVKMPPALKAANSLSFCSFLPSGSHSRVARWGQPTLEGAVLFQSGYVSGPVPHPSNGIAHCQTDSLRYPARHDLTATMTAWQTSQHKESCHVHMHQFTNQISVFMSGQIQIRHRIKDR